MIVDTSAVVAVLRGEQDAHRHLAAMEGADRLRMSAATLVELAVVVDARRDPVLSRRLDELVDVLGVEVQPFTAEQAAVARRAYRDYGKGSAHAAGLNLGDCFAYALAAVTGEALLFKGDDFAATDLMAALDDAS
ncbi:type II toxin-antitoxin system VapC family toxin [uncultured Pseudokineococcus sp.]|uniref:type II toxin-antitoxin system VapC family toxin n=1 Tax=uncultured Pseudokineococcus sp. TaxID=1642928 RepID=UPI0026309292|nr:type II toxin-antitoxin system VapC family toxin [uncultured Pseudokineococcus sp.]